MHKPWLNKKFTGSLLPNPIGPKQKRGKKKKRILKLLQMGKENSSTPGLGSLL
jgi:hypothetical protein